MEKTKKKTEVKGITLIALVITIIVLLILAAISITMLTGDNSILKQAVEAKEQNEIGQEKEIIALAYNSAVAKKMEKLDSTIVTAQELNTELTNQGANAKGNPIKVTFIESKRQYTINKNGEIKYEGIKNNDNNLRLAITPVETESRAVEVEVTVQKEGKTEPTEAELQAKSQEELKLMFVEAIKSLGAPFSSWNDISNGNEEMTVQDAFNKFNMSEMGYSNVYDLIIKTEIYKRYKFTCTGNDDIIGTSAKFIVTNPKPTITATSVLDDDSIEEVWNEYPDSKVEEYSTIQNSNYTITQGDYTAVVPAGFAYGTSSNIGSIATGLVITDSVEVVNGKNYSNGNEFVWIPVKNDLTVGKNTLGATNTGKVMAEKIDETDYRGVLYDWNQDQTGNTIIETNAYSSYRGEPAYIASFDDNNTVGINDSTLQNEYNAMIASVKRYGGFYVARYEIGDGAENISRINVMANGGITWYKSYSKAKQYNKTGVTSGMIWGSQWDAMLNFALTNPSDSAKVTASTNGNHNNTILKNGIWIGSNNQTDKINNIIDLEGNKKEWTMEARIVYETNNYEVDTSTSGRVLRGLSSKYEDSYGPSHRNYFRPGSGEDNYLWQDFYTTRVSLYINLQN